MLSERASLKVFVRLWQSSSGFLQFPWAKWERTLPKIMDKPRAAGGKAAVNEVFIQRLFVGLFTGVITERTGQEVVAVFAYECLHVGNVFLSVQPSGVMLLHENLS